jgi:alkylation response protein AidB-like acyl-CoA dehydrogenase
MVTKTDWTAVVSEIGPDFAARVAQHDQDDSFVLENYDVLKDRGLLTAGIPSEFGGGDATLEEICEMLRTLAHYCSSTALALSMHTHLVMATVWRYRNQNAPVGPLLERVVKERLVLVSTGGADWLDGSGTATKVENGYTINGRKIFCSGAPAGSILMTTAVVDEGEGPQVIHIPIPFSADGVKMLDTWRTIGMRGTGSNDITLEDVLVPETAVGVKRPAGVWHPAIHVVAMIAIPIVYSVYTGVAEAARSLALERAAKKRDDRDTQMLAGRMENELLSAQLAYRNMVRAGSGGPPSPETTNEVMICRTLVAKGAIATVERALELAGGAAFYRSAGIERLFRDVQASRFHPLREHVQLLYSGRVALGASIDD